MRTRSLSVALLLVTGTLLAGLIVVPVSVRAGTLYVGGAGPGNYTTIQAAVDAAGSGDTVFVYNGTYYENLVIKKNIALIGENKNTTIIDGVQETDVILVTGNYVNISGFTITNSSRNWNIGDSGIHAEEAYYSSFANNILVDNGRGITDFDSYKLTIENNVMRENFDGIYLTGSLVTVSRNLIVNNFFGIEAFHFSESLMVNNTIAYNMESVKLWYAGSGSRIYHNNIVENELPPCDDSQPEWGANQWDNGYPSGGNFWGYGCTDEMSGPNQDQPGGDGICDRMVGIEICQPHYPWEIKLDRYPLAYPLYSLGFPPRKPVNVGARLSGENLEDVTLTWSLSPDDGAGSRSVVGYKILRNSTYEEDAAGYQLLASLPNGTGTFVDGLAGEGDPSTYFYCICAFDASDNTECAAEQSGKFTHPLSRGPNLVSIPLKQSDESIETVLQTVEYEKAWYYDSFSQEWRWFMNSKNYRRGLWNISHTEGLWMNVTTNSNLTVAGIVPAQMQIQLYEGWNLVGVPSFGPAYTVADLKAETGATRVEGFDLTAPPHFLSVLADGEVLRAGCGYWVKVDSPTQWVVWNV